MPRERDRPKLERIGSRRTREAIGTNWILLKLNATPWIRMTLQTLWMRPAHGLIPLTIPRAMPRDRDRAELGPIEESC